MAQDDILKMGETARREALASAKGLFNKDPLIVDEEVLNTTPENPTNSAVVASMFEVDDVPPSVEAVKMDAGEAESPISAIEDVPEPLLVEPVSEEPKTEENIITVENKEEIDPQEELLIENLKSARKQFAKTEYADRTRMNRIRKALKMSLEGNEENPNIESARKPYEMALKEFMEYKVDKLAASGLTGKVLEAKVKDIYSLINLKEVPEYYNARTEAKMEYLAGNKKDNGEEKGFFEKSWDFVRLGSSKIAESYNKWPTSVKLGLVAATFIPGASAFALGKRTWGAFMLMAAGGMQLDKGAQFVDGFLDKRARNKEFKNIAEDDGNVDFNRLKEVLGGKIDNIDTKLNNKNLRSGVNKFLAFSGALFLGGSIIKGAIDFAEGKEVASTKLLGKWFGKLFVEKSGIDAVANNAVENSSGAKVSFNPNNLNPADSAKMTTFDKDNVYPPDSARVATVFDKDNVYAPDSARATVFDKNNLYASDSARATTVFDKNNVYSPDSATPLVDSFEKNGVPTETGSLTIKEGSSIEKTLIDHLKSHGIKDSGAAAHRMWLDYMHDNKAEIVRKAGESEYLKKGLSLVGQEREEMIQKLGNGEYDKMLKDGMVNVKAGTKLILDEHDPLKIKLHDIGGKISHLENNGALSTSSASAGVENMDNASQEATPSQATAKVASVEASSDSASSQSSANGQSSEAPPVSGEDSEIVADQEEIARLNKAYNDEIDRIRDDGDSSSGSDRSRLEEIQKEREIYRKDLMEREGFSQQLKTNLKELRQGLTGVKGGSSEIWDEIKGRKLESVYAHDNPKVVEALKGYFKLYDKGDLNKGIVGIGRHGVTAGDGETLEQWTFRISRMSLEKSLGIKNE
ncbi:MAG: hypothetical protein ACD_8C00057G0023 [uncultured bacterium]|nr:MAG: hypothetical protein ACD_8C00057G0023 [uncultured bacterium]